MNICIQTISSVIGAVATAGLFILAWCQLSAIRKENKHDRTLRICFAFDSDPVISKAVSAYRKSQEDKSEISNHEAKTLVNYFDTIAIGELSLIHI